MAHNTNRGLSNNVYALNKRTHTHTHIGAQLEC